jgi:hypothetical protein
MPGRDIDEAIRAVVGELPELPFLPHLPARGGGADPVGRTLALLVDIWAEVTTTAWRVTRRPTPDLRRATDFLAWDLDALEAHASGVPRLKIQLTGPWTLAASVELTTGNRVLTDAGAVADVTESLAEGMRLHLGELRKRLPGTEFVVQLDEPELGRVLDGTLPTASGLATVSAVTTAHITERLSSVMAIPDVSWAVATPGRVWPVLASLPVAAVAVDLGSTALSAARLDPLGELLERGVVVLAASIPLDDPRPLAVAATALAEPLRVLGFSPKVIAEQVIPMPVMGLEAASLETAAKALRRAGDVARQLADTAGLPT